MRIHYISDYLYKKDINSLTSKTAYFEFIYALIVNSEYKTSEKLFRFLYDNSIDINVPDKQYAYLLLLILLKNDSRNDFEERPLEYTKLAYILHYLAIVTEMFGKLNKNNPLANVEWKIQLLKNFLETKLILYWHKCNDNKNKINIKRWQSYGKPMIQYNIMKEGNYLVFYNSDVKFNMAYIREIEDNPSLSRFATIYKAIGNSINIAEKQYCPFCNPNKPLRKRGSKIGEACDDCKIIRQFIADNEGINIKSLDNQLRKISHDILLYKIQARGKILMKHLQAISDKVNNAENLGIVSKLKQISDLITSKFYLKDDNMDVKS